MATPVFCCGFECGVDTGVSHVQLNGTASFTATNKRTGVLCLRTNPTAGKGYSFTDLPGVSTVWVGRQYLYIASAPIASGVVTGFTAPAIGTLGLAYKTTDSKWYAAFDDGTTVTYGATGVTLATGAQIRIDIKANVSANPWLIDVSADGVALGQASFVHAAGSLVYYHCGAGLFRAVNTFDLFHDDLILSTTAGDYPIGAGYVLSYIPDADGTHNVAGADDFERTFTGTDIINGVTTAWQLVDERPLPTTEVDFINIIAPPNSTDYVEITYEDSAETSAPRAVEALITYHSATGAGNNNLQVTLRDSGGGTTADIFNGNAKSGATISYNRAHFSTIPGTASAWTTVAFNALRSRILSSDAAPDVYLDALMLEAEFPPAAGGAATWPGWYGRAGWF